MSGHWSEKARNEANLFGEVKEVAVDPKGGEGKTLQIWAVADGNFDVYNSERFSLDL